MKCMQTPTLALWSGYILRWHVPWKQSTWSVFPCVGGLTPLLHWASWCRVYPPAHDGRTHVGWSSSEARTVLCCGQAGKEETEKLGIMMCCGQASRVVMKKLCIVGRRKRKKWRKLSSTHTHDALVKQNHLSINWWIHILVQYCSIHCTPLPLLAYINILSTFLLVCICLSICPTVCTCIYYL